MNELREWFGVQELVGLLGLGLMATGLALVSIPAALSVTGAMLFGLAVWPYVTRRVR